MKNFSKIILSILIISSLFSCSWFKAKRSSDVEKNSGQNSQKPEPKDQYRIAENFSGNKSQMIDLIAGPATFDIKFEGSSRFLAIIMKNDGTVLDTLVNVTGSYKGTKEITVPVTTGYVLDVRCEGIWSIYRK